MQCIRRNGTCHNVHVQVDVSVAVSLCSALNCKISMFFSVKTQTPEVKPETVKLAWVGDSYAVNFSS